jgi:hypothetical protein
MTPVKEDQFEISDKGIKHTPTGYEFIPHPGQPFSGNVHLGHHGSKLPSGEDYDPSEVKAMMGRLWNAHVKKSGLPTND